MKDSVVLVRHTRYFCHTKLTVLCCLNITQTTSLLFRIQISIVLLACVCCFFSFCRKKNRRIMYINVNGAQCRYLLCSARISKTSDSQHTVVFIAHRVYGPTCFPTTKQHCQSIDSKSPRPASKHKAHLVYRRCQINSNQPFCRKR